MVDYGEAFKRPFSDWKKLGIGALMYLIPFVNMITGLFASGYMVNCAKSAMKKDFKLPEWDDWGDLIIKGLLLLVISIIYMIPALIVVLVAVGSSIVGMISAASSGYASAGAGMFGVGMIIAVLAMLITWYILPVAILRFADKENFGAAFSFGEIFKKAFTGTYAVAWLATLGISIVTGIVAMALSVLLAITVVGPMIVSAIINIIVGIIGISILAQAYEEA